MSASNWDICPRCRYADPDAPEEEHRTFREDYEIYGAATGSVRVVYGGHCASCDLRTSFDFVRVFYVPGGGVSL